MKSAIWKLAAFYPKLAKAKTSTTSYELLLKFFNYSERSKFLLELSGGADYLRDFVINYQSNIKKYKAPSPSNPVIIVVDNDTGPNGIISYVSNIDSAKVFPANLDVKKDIRKSDFVHIFHNLYLVLTPLPLGCSTSDIELLFNDVDRLRQHKGKCFNTDKARDDNKDLSKDAFATHIVSGLKVEVDFEGFKPFLGRILQAIEHYDSIKISK